MRCNHCNIIFHCYIQIIHFVHFKLHLIKKPLSKCRGLKLYIFKKFKIMQYESSAENSTSCDTYDK
jgi:hypothetical protein